MERGDLVDGTDKELVGLHEFPDPMVELGSPELGPGEIDSAQVPGGLDFLRQSLLELRMLAGVQFEAPGGCRAGRGGQARWSPQPAPSATSRPLPKTGPGSPRLPASPRGMERPTIPVPRSPRCPGEVKARLACRWGETRSGERHRGELIFSPQRIENRRRSPWAEVVFQDQQCQGAQSLHGR